MGHQARIPVDSVQSGFLDVPLCISPTCGRTITSNYNLFAIFSSGFPGSKFTTSLPNHLTERASNRRHPRYSIVVVLRLFVPDLSDFIPSYVRAPKTGYILSYSALVTVGEGVGRGKLLCPFLRAFCEFTRPYQRCGAVERAVEIMRGKTLTSKLHQI